MGCAYHHLVPHEALPLGAAGGGGGPGGGGGGPAGGLHVQHVQVACTNWRPPSVIQVSSKCRRPGCRPARRLAGRLLVPAM
eukprot:1177219-Prorocentrum_minimum.AAC.7